MLDGNGTGLGSDIGKELGRGGLTPCADGTADEDICCCTFCVDVGAVIFLLN